MIAIDKQAHFFAGAAIASTTTLYTDQPLIGLALAVLVGGLKEVWDRAGYGTPDLKDFIATAAGAIVVLPLYI